MMKLSQKPSNIKRPYLPFENPDYPDNKNTNFESQIIFAYHFGIRVRKIA